MQLNTDISKKSGSQNIQNNDYLLPVGVFLVSLFVKVWNVSVPTNTDEALWITRGIAFMNAVLSGNLAETYLKHHPGITNMWLIGSTQLVNTWFHHIFPKFLGLEQEPLAYTCLEPPINCAPLSLYVTSRLLQALVTSGCMVLIFILTKKLLGRNIAVLTSTFLLFEPFYIAYQRFITTDALQINFSIISVLFYLLYLKGEGKRQELILSGIFFGSAIASKVPALFVIPAIIIWLVLIELGLWKDGFFPRGWKRQTLDLIIFGTIAGLTIFFLFPALWGAPVETLQTWYTGLQGEENRGNLFFMGEVTSNPGLLFYPIVFLFRFSPLFHLGLIALLLTLIIPRLRKNLRATSELFAIALVPIFILTILSLSDSKIDRYILLAAPELAILSAIGWTQFYQWLKKPFDVIFSKDIFFAVFLIIVQAIFSLSYQPHYLTYFNPVFGGIRTAKNFILVGQGEGLDVAAKYLNKLPNAEQIQVSSWYGAPFELYFPGKTSLMYWAWTATPKLNLLLSNYVVLYVNQLQRQLPSADVLDYFLSQKPLFNWVKDKVRYVSIYPGLSPTPQNLADIQNPLSLTWDERVTLLGYDLDNSQLKANEIIVTFYWKIIKSFPLNTELNISVNNEKTEIFSSSDKGFVRGYIPFDFEGISPGKILRDSHKIVLQEEKESGLYNLDAGWNFSSSSSENSNGSNRKTIDKIHL